MLPSVSGKKRSGNNPTHARSLGYVLLAVFSAVLLLSASSAQPTRGIAVSIDSIRIVDEDDNLSNDEPYLIMTRMKGRITQAGVTDLEVNNVMSGQENIRNRQNWANEGSTYDLDDATPRIAQGTVPVNQPGWVIGAVIVHMEQDGFSRRSASILSNQVESYVQSTLSNMSFATIDTSSISAAVASSIGDRLKRDLGSKNLVSIFRGLASVADPDDFGGFYVVFVITGQGGTAFSVVGPSGNLTTSSAITNETPFELGFPVGTAPRDLPDNARFLGRHRVMGTIKTWIQTGPS